MLCEGCRISVVFHIGPLPPLLDLVRRFKVGTLGSPRGQKRIRTVVCGYCVERRSGLLLYLNVALRSILDASATLEDAVPTTRLAQTSAGEHDESFH
jgi:hypothetical protein